MPIALLWLQLLGAAVIILAASNFLAKSADVIALKTGLGRSFIGVVLLATATSLPELGTGVSSIVLIGAPDLAAGDAFGSNIFNLLIIGLLDLFWRDGPILNKVNTTSAVVGTLGIILISLTAIGMFVHEFTTALSTWYVSPVSIVMVVVFVVAIYIVYKFEMTQDNSGSDDSYDSYGLPKAFLLYAMSAGIIIASAIWLANIGDGLTHAMGWEASFVGTQFLAFSTSLPELAASFAAIRINAPELAITNVLGSNLFNMGFILFLDDLVLAGTPLWGAISIVHAMTAIVGILMTAIVIIALLSRMRTRPSRYWTVEALLLIALYAVSSYLVFTLG